MPQRSFRRGRQGELRLVTDAVFVSSPGSHERCIIRARTAAGQRGPTQVVERRASSPVEAPVPEENWFSSRPSRPFFATFAVKRFCLYARDSARVARSLRTWLALIPLASQHRQARIFRKSRIVERKLTHYKHRPAVRLDPPSMLTVGAQAGLLFIEIVAARHGCLGELPPRLASESTTSAPACAPTPHTAPRRCWSR
jgi:hypothetical protein